MIGLSGLLWFATVNDVAPMGFINDPSNKRSLTLELCKGVFPVCVILDKSSKLITLHVAPVSSWHSSCLPKWSELLRKFRLVRSCFPCALTEDTSSMRNIGSSSDSSTDSLSDSLTARTSRVLCFEDKQTEAK